MATAEAAGAASLGPRYAPDDPTLPQPWKGLVDGTTGVLYYWNPETNVTQYEKPTCNPPPLPQGLPPSTGTPKLAPIPGAQVPQQQTTQNASHEGQHQHGRPHLTQLPMQQQMSQGGPPQTYQFPHQHMPYQQNMPPQTQHTMGQQFSPSHAQKAGLSPFHSSVTGANAGQMQQSGGQFANAPGNMQQQQPFGQSMQSAGDFSQQQRGPMFQNQMGGPTGSMHGRPSDGRAAGNEYYSSANNDGAMMAPPQPRLAAIPMPRDQREMRMGNIPSQALSGYPVGFNPAAGPPMQNMYTQGAGGPPFSNNAIMRPPGMTVSSDGGSVVDVYRRKHEVSATGQNVPDPFMSFEATGFPPELLREIHSAGFASPTPIQAQTWPIALQNMDIVAIAKTGSGKTLGYLIPAFMLLRHLRNNALNGPTVVVLAPTRELATQIQDEVIKFGRSSRISCTCLYGGAPKALQLKELDRGADIVVATPGRLNDILEMKKVDFRQVALLVLDEADRMLDMGFEPQIRKIVNEIPPRRQTLMYTATWPKEVRKIAGDLLVNPVQVNIGNVDELAANKSITQHVEVVHQSAKERRLEQILRSQERGSKIIIFCATKRLCDQLARTVGRSFGAAAIHGDKNQSERDWVLGQFRSGKSPILVATDVAARGLDIKDIRVVVNYDFPTGVEDYVHRIGRTGRAGATGVAYTFFSDQDWKYAADLIKLLEGADQMVPQELRDIAARGVPIFNKDRGGMTRFDSSGDGGERWDSGGRGGARDGGFGRGRGGIRDGGFGGGRGGMRDGNFDGRGGMRDSGFGGRGEMRDSSFGGRGDMRGGGYGGRGGMRDGGRGGMRDGGYGGRGDMRDGGGRGGMRDGGYGGGRGGSRGGGGGNDRRQYNRNNDNDNRGRGGSGGQGDSRRESRGRSYSSSPERVRTWGGYGKSRSRSRSYSRSRSRSYSRSRSVSRSRSPRRRSRSPTPTKRVRRRESKFDQMEPQPESALPISIPPPDNSASAAATVHHSNNMPQLDATLNPINPATEP